MIFLNEFEFFQRKRLKFLEQQRKKFLFFHRFSSIFKISSEDILPGLRVSGCRFGEKRLEPTAERRVLLRPFLVRVQQNRLSRFYHFVEEHFATSWLPEQGGKSGVSFSSVVS